MKQWPTALTLVLVLLAIAVGGWNYILAVHDAEQLHRIGEYCGKARCVVQIDDQGVMHVASEELVCPKSQGDFTRPSMRF